MRISTKRILSIGFALFFFIGALLVYFNLISGEGTTINQLRGELAAKQSLLKNQTQIVTQVQNLIQQFQNLTQLQNSVGLAVPVGDQTVSALRQMEAIARMDGVALTSADFKSALDQVRKTSTSTQSLIKRSGTLTVDIAAAGSYPNLKSFLTHLETAVRVTNVVEAKFTPAPSPNAADVLAVTAQMYYQAP